MSTSYRQLNPRQEEAIRTTEGRLLVLAGAGSGKTSVIIGRICHLLEHKKVPPTAILGLTFTNKAAEEMRSRIAKATHPKLAQSVTLCTFHSFCMQVLRSEIERLGYTKHFTLYDDRDMRRLLLQRAQDLFEGDKIPSLDKSLEAIKDAKTRGLSSQDLSPLESEEETKLAKDLLEDLPLSLRAYNAVDFDSLISLTVKLFDEHPEILSLYQERFRYIMIDEYQDTNNLQYRLASQLSQGSNNLCVVGDDDQSIYAWRGAEIRHILNFPADHTIKLEQNYRSTPNILKVANCVIRNNKERHEKELFSTKPNGQMVEIFHAPTEEDEAQAVVDRMIKLRQEKGLKWNDMAILYRSNILSRPFETMLLNTMWKKKEKWIRGIPYQIFGGTELFSRAEVKDLMAYLKILVNPRDQSALLRIINYPRRGISNKTLDLLTQSCRKNRTPLLNLMREVNQSHPLRESISARGLGGIASFLSFYDEAKEQFQKEPPSKAFKWMIERIGYKKAIEDEVKSEKAQEMKWNNVQECILAVTQFEQDEEGGSLSDFLSTTLLDDTQLSRKSKSFSEDRISLMTFHSAKGLEFPACFIIGLEDHILPHEKSHTSKGIEEERRLFYVAITRAQEHLSLSMCQKRKRHGKEKSSTPSRFLYEIPKEHLKVASWRVF